MALKFLKQNPDNENKPKEGAGREQQSAQLQGPSNLRFIGKTRGTGSSRTNGKKSKAGRPTGPLTDEGKSRSRLNAVKHGSYAKEFVFIGFEEPAEFDRLYAGLIDEWRATSPTAEFLVGQLANSFWRSRRLARIEAALGRRAQLEAIWEPYGERSERAEDLRDQLRRDRIADVEEELDTAEKLICRLEANGPVEDLPKSLEELSLADIFTGIDFADRDLLLEKLLLAHERLNVEMAALCRDELPVVVRAYAAMAPVDLDRCRADLLRETRRLLRTLISLQDWKRDQE